MATDKNSGTTSLLSKKVKIEGDIQGDEDLRVDGHFKGTIKVVGDIIVGPSGVVEADVEESVFREAEMKQCIFHDARCVRSTWLRCTATRRGPVLAPRRPGPSSSGR